VLLVLYQRNCSVKKEEVVAEGFFHEIRNRVSWPKIFLKKHRLSGISENLTKSLFEICVAIEASSKMCSTQKLQ